MARQATAKLTSEERCRKAFEAWYDSLGIEAADPRDPEPNILDEDWGGTKNSMRWGWQACWQYLQTTVTKEFIES